MDHRDHNLGDKAHSCSTFMLTQGEALLVGHNLDEYIDIPGLVVVNKRGTSKMSIGWGELIAEGTAPLTRRGRFQWTSKYGSVTYTTRGRECIDGGMNEVGLYIGEMTLMGTEYPEVPKVPRMYQVLWMQYLLDCFGTVAEVLAHLNDVQLEGTCQWHFFVSDRTAQAAVIEFLGKQPVIHTGSELPIPLVCNASYQAEMERLKQYAGFGGAIPIGSADDADLRFIWGAQMLSAPGTLGQAPLERAWAILTRLQGESNRWGIIYDVRNARMHFRTNEAPEARYIDFSSFDFSPGTPVLILDINEDLCGDVANRFEVFTHTRNREFIARFWDEVDGGEEFNLAKSRLIEHSAQFIEAMDAGMMCA